MDSKKRPFRHSIVAVVGFILSPLSWWNDWVVNIPLAYLFSWPFAQIRPSLFLPTFVLGYWLTNWLGLLLLHRGAAAMLRGDGKPPLHAWRRELLVATGYSLLIVLLVWIGWIPSPAKLADLF